MERFKSGIVRSGWTALLLAYAYCLPAALADPALTVTSLGPNLSGNLEWLVEVTPDAALFSNTDLGLGGSVAVELAFEVHGSELLSATVNNVDWPLETAGNDPFTAGVTTGLDLDAANDTLFAPLLSVFFTSNAAVELLTLETEGTDCTTVVWGGHTLLGGTAHEYEGSLISQGGQNFTGYVGSLTIPPQDGDFDADCDVDGHDLLAWQRLSSISYDASDLADWEANYSAKAPLQAVIARVPEPTSVWLLLSAAIGWSSLRRL